MEFTVTHNNNTEYSVEFNEEVAIIKVRDLNQGLFNTSLVLPIDAWYLLEAQRQEFRRFHMSRVIITNNQEGTLNMEKQVEEMSGYQPYGQLVPAQYQTGSIDYEFNWETGVDYSVNEDGTAQPVFEGSIPRRADLQSQALTIVQESVNDLGSTAVHESVNDLEVISAVPDNPTSPQSGSSSRPIVIDSGSVQENVDPVTPVSRRPTEPPVFERARKFRRFGDSLENTMDSVFYHPTLYYYEN